MKKYCSFCGENRELIKEGKAQVCLICKANQFRNPRGKVIKSIDRKTYDYYLRKRAVEKKGSTLKMGPIE